MRSSGKGHWRGNIEDFLQNRDIDRIEEKLRQQKEAVLQKHRMEILGFSREVTLIDYGVTGDPEKFVTEICIPVKCE